MNHGGEWRGRVRYGVVRRGLANPPVQYRGVTLKQWYVYK